MHKICEQIKRSNQPPQTSQEAKRRAEYWQGLVDNADAHGLNAEDVNFLQDSIEHVIDYGEQLLDDEYRLGKSHGSNPTDGGESALSRSGKKGQWVDKAGQPVHVLSAKDSLTDAMGGSAALGGRATEPEVTPGQAVRSIITGEGLQAAQSVGSHSAGGYLLEPTLSNRLIDLARADAVVMRAGAQTVAMPSSELVMAKVDSDPTVSWIAEEEKFPQSSATFGRLTLRARKMGTIVPISIELARDAPNAEAEIERLLRTAVALELDRAALLGSGKGEEPVGIFNQSDVLENDLSGAIDWDTYLDGVKAIEDENGEPGAIIYPPLVKSDLAKLKVNSEANHYATPPQQLSDLSRFTTTQLGDGQSVIGDFSQVMIGVRSGVEIAATDMVATSDGQGFERDQVLVKIRWRGDVQFAHPKHIQRIINITS
jgi:HK97 family phage major capsid protein